MATEFAAVALAPGPNAAALLPVATVPSPNAAPPFAATTGAKAVARPQRVVKIMSRRTRRG
jgi:hypothetical protein